MKLLEFGNTPLNVSCLEIPVASFAFLETNLYIKERK